MTVTDPQPDANPWLQIPAADYEGHMASPQVGQLQMLNRVLGELLRRLQPAALAVPGCSAGNGFEHIDPAVTRRVVGIDIHPEYLDLLERRFSARLHGLELQCADLTDCDLTPEAFDLVYCALVLEYLDPRILVPKMARWTRPGGTLAIVLQLPTETGGTVSETPYTRLKRLQPILNLVSPEAVCCLAEGAELAADRSRKETMANGKAFQILCFVKPHV